MQEEKNNENSNTENIFKPLSDNLDQNKETLDASDERSDFNSDVSTQENAENIQSEDVFSGIENINKNNDNNLEETEENTEDDENAFRKSSRASYSLLRNKLIENRRRRKNKFLLKVALAISIGAVVALITFLFLIFVLEKLAK